MTFAGPPLVFIPLLTRRLVRYGGALVAVVAAMGLRLALEQWCGPGLPAYITFYPTVMAVSILAGFGPGALATAAAMTAAMWIIPPIGQFSISSPIDQVAMLVFLAMGLIMSMIAEVYRRNRSKVEAYEREALLRESREAVRESEVLFRSIFDNNLDAVLLTTPEGEILVANAEAKRLFGRSEEELRALGRQGVADLTDPRLAPALAQRAAQGWYRGELTAIDAGGRKFPVEISSSIFLGRGGQRMTNMLVRDITDRQQADAALRAALADAERANNAKSRFLAAASHDLRQPLSALSVYAGLLKNNTSEPPDPKLVANMHDCIADLSDLLTDLLDLSKLEAGVVSPRVSDFMLAPLLSNLEAVYGPDARDKALQLRCADSRLTARTDPILFKRILGNLVDNALRYTERGGALIACRRRQGKTWVEVWDTGIGIPADKTADIFEEFKQLGDGARSRGSGLGLAIAARTAALLGLEIGVRSRLGRGSVFAVELPLGQAQLFMPPPRRVLSSGALRIALVEDNLLVREALVIGLRGLGHQVVASVSTADLLGKLDLVPPDIIISDYRLTQGETGYDVITAVRARYRAELPAFLITGDTDPKLLRRMTDRGVVVLHKPLDLEHLQACLDDLTCQKTPGSRDSCPETSESAAGASRKSSAVS